MSNSEMQAKLVRIEIAEGRAGLFYAESPDLKGLLVAENSLSALYEAIPQAISAMYAACGEPVIVHQVEVTGQQGSPWVAIPVELAKRQLQMSAA